VLCDFLTRPRHLDLVVKVFLLEKKVSEFGVRGRKKKVVMFVIIGYASRNARDSIGVNCIMVSRCLARSDRLRAK
jgi:hypothetical protein